MTLPALLAFAVGIAGRPVPAQLAAPASHPFTNSGIYADGTPRNPDPNPGAQQPGSEPAPAPQPQTPGPFTRRTMSGYNTREKFIYDTKNVFGPVPLLFNAVGAAIGQGLNSPYEWGQGATGYADRFASSFGLNLAHQYIGFGLETTFHEDPRYMPSQDRSAKARLRSVLRQSFRARRDSGGETIAYARLGSAFGAGLLSDTWQPKSANGIGDGFIRGGEILAIDVGANFAQEFIPFVRRFQVR